MISEARFFGGSGYTSSATSFDLDWRNRVHSISMTAGSQSVSLPDARISSLKPGRQWYILNVGANSFTVLDDSGGTVATVPAADAAIISLISQATTAGVWLADVRDIL